MLCWQFTFSVLFLSYSLKKLFAGISTVEFSCDSRRIVAMCSSKGEKVPLSKAVQVTEEVEVWLQHLSVAMKATLADALVECAKAKDFRKFPSQVAQVAEMVAFTEQVELAINQGTLDALVTQLKAKLEELTGIDAANDVLLRLKVKALIFDLIHNIEVGYCAFRRLM
jgi:hypothetical protein